MCVGRVGRMKDIITHGLEDIKAHKEARKGPLQTLAEDWEWLPRGFRSWIQNANGEFVDVIAR